MSHAHFEREGSSWCIRRSFSINATMFVTVRPGRPSTLMSFPLPASAKPGIALGFIP
jgi:hypothetical protein